MKAVYALYADADAADRAVGALRRAGVDSRRITVMSAEPYEDHRFARGDKATWMYWIAGAGGAIGLAIGTLLTWKTETSWPLVTGGMPIVAWWPNLVIMFELTMLGSILATVATLLVTAKLPSRRGVLYDAAIADGRILVGVEGESAGELAGAERALSESGDNPVKTL